MSGLTPGQQFGINMLFGGLSSFDQSSAMSAQSSQSLRNAAHIRKLGELQSEQVRKEGQKVLGFQRANLAASGVDIGSGSALDFLAEQASTVEFNAQQTRHMAELQALQAEAEARAAKKAAKRGRFMGAAQLGLAAYGILV